MLPTEDRRTAEEVVLHERRQRPRLRHAAVDQRGGALEFVLGQGVFQVRGVADRPAVARLDQLRIALVADRDAVELFLPLGAAPLREAGVTAGAPLDLEAAGSVVGISVELERALARDAAGQV